MIKSSALLPSAIKHFFVTFLCCYPPPTTPVRYGGKTQKSWENIFLPLSPFFWSNRSVSRKRRGWREGEAACPRVAKIILNSRGVIFQKKFFLLLRLPLGFNSSCLFNLPSLLLLFSPFPGCHDNLPFFAAIFSPRRVCLSYLESRAFYKNGKFQSKVRICNIMARLKYFCNEVFVCT